MENKGQIQTAFRPSVGAAYTVAVLDDDANGRERLLACLRREKQRLSPDADILFLKYASGDSLLNDLQRRGADAPDICFLDIGMKSGIDGMEVARRLRGGTLPQPVPSAAQTFAVSGACSPSELPVLIFTTGYPERMPEAFYVRAFRYLVKPFSDAEVSEAFRGALLECNGVKAREALLREASAKENTPFLLVKDKRGIEKIPVRDICFAESVGRKVVLHLVDKEIAYYERLGALEKKLPADLFFRTHRSFLVNLSHIRSYTRSEIVLPNGGVSFLSKYRYREFVARYLQTLAEDAKA